MKYLKLYEQLHVFNESSESNFKNLYDTCLVELYDDGFKLTSISQETLVFKLGKDFVIKSSNVDKRKWIGDYMGKITGRINKISKNTIISSSKYFSVNNLLPYQRELLDKIYDASNKLLHTFNCKEVVFELETLYLDSYNNLFINNEIKIFYKLVLTLNT